MDAGSRPEDGAFDAADESPHLQGETREGNETFDSGPGMSYALLVFLFLE